MILGLRLHYTHSLSNISFGRIVVHFCLSLFRKYKLDPRSCGRRPREKLLICAESAKRGLTTLETASAHAESLAEGIDLQAQVTRARFDNEVVGKVRDIKGENRIVFGKLRVEETKICTTLCSLGRRVTVSGFHPHF